MKLAGAVLLNGRCDAEWCSQSVVVERMPIESEMSICFRSAFTTRISCDEGVDVVYHSLT